MRVLVLGGGVVGVTTAYFLARDGHEVIVVDSAASVATGTSFANGGQLSYSYTDPLASPAIVPKLASLALGQDPSFTMRPPLDPALAKWIAQFLRNCTGEREAYNTRNVLRLALYSRQMMHEVTAAHEIAFNYTRCGKLHIYGGEAALAEAAKKTALKNSYGCRQQVLGRDECLALEPALAATAGDIAGGIYSPLDEAGDAHLFAIALADIARDRFGAAFRYGERIADIRSDGDRVLHVTTERDRLTADAFVIALGPYSPLIARSVGLDIPIYPLKGYSITVPAGPTAPQVSITDTRHKMVFCTLGDRLRIAGMAELVGYEDSVAETKIAQIVDVARQRFPTAGDYDTLVHRWSGLRPATPGSAPLLGRTRYDNLFLNTGQGMLGWTLAAGSARIVADICNGRKPSIDLTGLTL